MAYAVKLPKLGLEMEQGTILEWYVEEGAEIEEGETLLEVESEKSIGEVDAREDGVLRLLAITEGEAVPPGTPIGIIAGVDEDVGGLEAEFDGDEAAGTGSNGTEGDKGGSEPGRDDSGNATEATADTTPEAEGGTTEAPSGSAATDVKASPRAKRRAEEIGVDLAGIGGTGPQGAITAEDVDMAAEAAADAAVGDEASSEGNGKDEASEGGNGTAASGGAGGSGSELHPQAEELLHSLSAAGVPPLYRQSVADARETYRDLCIPDAEPEPVGAVADGTVPGPEGDVPVRVYDPGRGEGDASETSEAHDGRPVLLFFHGGGWMTGDVATHDGVCRALANRVRGIVVSVEYRRAPEHPFPAALEDCYAVAAWLGGGPDLGGIDPELAGVGIDPERVAVGGDSAGGTLAAGVALLARDRGTFAPCRQLLAYPATDHGFETDSYTENANGYFITRDDMERFWGEYVETDLDGAHPYASPLRASDLADLPPTTVLTCGFDPLRDDGAASADRLAEAGVDVSRIEYDHMIHGFLTMLADPEWERAREAISDLGADLERAFEA
jgi:acetyl esterase